MIGFNIKTIILTFSLTLLTNLSLFATTANPNQRDKPCTPPCCKELKESRIRVYYCGWVYYKCLVQCKLQCVDRDGFFLASFDCGSYFVDKLPFCKFFGGYTVVNNYCLEPTEDNSCTEADANLCVNRCYCVKIEPEWRCHLESQISPFEINLCELSPIFGC